MRRKSLAMSALLPVLTALLFVAGCGSIAGEKSIKPTSRVFRYCNPIHSDVIGPIRDATRKS